MSSGVSYQVANNRKILEFISRCLDESKTIGFDTESSGPQLLHQDMVNLWRAELTGYSVYIPETASAFYIPLRHRENNVPLEAGLQLLGDVLRSPCVKRAHSVKHEIKAVAQDYGSALTPGNWEDSQILPWLLNRPVEGKSPFGLKAQAREFLGIEMHDFKAVVGKDRVFADLDPLLPETYHYACEDAVGSHLLAEQCLPLMDAFPGLLQVFKEREMPFVWVLRHMEDTGMCIDAAYLNALAGELDTLIAPYREEWDYLSDGMNHRSPKQLQTLFEDETWLKDLAEVNTKSGTYKTNRETMEGIAASRLVSDVGRRLAQLKMELSEAEKIRGTYCGPLVEQASQYPDGRIHASFHHTGTVTGRLSHSDPNLGNIPTRTAFGKRVMRAFVAPGEGWSMLSADESQLELRLLAHFAGGSLADAYQKDEDIHQQTADFTGLQRNPYAKNLNFAMIYGARGKKLGRMLGCSPKDAEGYYEKLMGARPEIARLHERMIAAADRRGYIKTLGGRFRPIPELRSSSRGIRWRGERLVKNTPIQGSAADLVKIAMLNFYNYLAANHELERVQIADQVHDDVICYVKDECREDAARSLKREMESAMRLNVPLRADPKFGQSWYELKG